MFEFESDYDNHPVFKHNEVFLETAPFTELKNKLHQWLWTGATGGVILGSARSGKSMACEQLATKPLLWTRGNIAIPTYYLSIAKRDKPTIRAIFRLLCSRYSLRTAPTDRTDDLSDRFIHYLTDGAAQAQCSRVVLIVDEMQRLTMEQFGPFTELYDRLRLLGLSLLVVFVGNEQESNKTLRMITHSEYAHLRGRFFIHGHHFSGLRTREDVEQCLAQYDRLRYPDEGPTYTEFFVPEAFRTGWRLASLSGILWRVFRQYQKNYQIPDWGMQYFASTVSVLLRDYLSKNRVELCDEDMIDACFQVSGLVASPVLAVK
ncbi:MAG: ATP-binding protein [Gammaproteobacteria bacterium]|nr:MAG: ATP-binding protein [Gammaproteobacteria bacterium]